MYVCAFGDSPLDLSMLRMANEAVVVIGEQQERSKTMDAELMKAIDVDGLQAHPMRLPSKVLRRLNPAQLPKSSLRRSNSKWGTPSSSMRQGKGQPSS